MATEEPGIKPVVLYVNGEAVSTLNPLPATGGGGGGGGGIVDQGVGSGLPTGAWTVRISNGSGFLAPLTNTELRATPVPVSASTLPLPTGAASETTLGNAVTELVTVNSNLTDIQTAQTDGTQRSKITDGTNNVSLINSAPGGTEYSVPVRQVGAATLPTGAATEATLSALNGKTPTVGQKAMAASQPVTIAVDQTYIPVQIEGLLPNDLNVGAVHVNEFNSLDISVTEPVAGFGEMLTIEPAPRAQIDAIYGILQTDVETLTDGVSGSATAANALFSCQTGTGVGGYGVIRSRRIVRARPGQACQIGFTTLFTSPVANNLQLAGGFTASDGLFVGYRGTTFGYLRRIPGTVAIYRLTITAGSTGIETLTITLNDVPFTVMTGGALSTAATAQLVAARVGGYTGWSSLVSPTSNGATVTFMQNTPAVAAGTYSFASTGGATGIFAQLQTGAPNDDVTAFVPQTSWNVDRLDGSKGTYNPSGMLLDQTKLNVYQIVYTQGASAIYLRVMTPSRRWVTVHIDQYPNSSTVPSAKNPSYRLGWIAASLGSTTNLTVKGATSSGFVQGISRTLRDPYGLSQVFTGVSTVEYAYLLIRNRAEFQSLVNQRQLLPFSVGVNVETANRIGRVRFVLNPTLSSTVDWQYVDQTASSTEYAVPTSVTISGGRQIAAVDAVTQTEQNFSGLDLRMEAGDILAIAIRTSSSTATISTSINWHEE